MTRNDCLLKRFNEIIFFESIEIISDYKLDTVLPIPKAVIRQFKHFFQRIHFIFMKLISIPNDLYSDFIFLKV